jgi:hypothetical protein
VILGITRNVGLVILIDRKSADGEGGSGGYPGDDKLGHVLITDNAPGQPAFPMVNTEI